PARRALAESCSCDLASTPSLETPRQATGDLPLDADPDCPIVQHSTVAAAAIVSCGAPNSDARSVHRGRYSSHMGSRSCARQGRAAAAWGPSVISSDPLLRRRRIAALEELRLAFDYKPLRMANCLHLPYIVRRALPAVPPVSGGVRGAATSGRGWSSPTC